jgi:hypothetical protein
MYSVWMGEKLYTGILVGKPEGKETMGEIQEYIVG